MLEQPAHEWRQQVSTVWFSIDSLRKQQVDSSHLCSNGVGVCAGQSQDSHRVKGF